MSMAALKWAREPRPDLGGVARAVLRDLADRANESGVCWPSVRTISADTGFTRRTVQYALRRLEEAGLLSVNQIDGRSSRYVLALPAQEMRTRGARDAHPGAGDAPKASRSVREENRRARAPEEPRPNADAYRKADAGLPDVVVDQAALDLARGWLER